LARMSSSGRLVLCGLYYLRGADDTADEAEWRTEIGWPIFRADRPPGAGG
jgi:hypothetical protein